MAFTRSLPTAFFNIYPETPAFRKREMYSRSSYCVRTIILMFGADFLSSTVASSPPSFGMPMSMRMMSGLNLWARSMTSIPSDASQTTSMSSHNFRNAAMPSLTSAWSSAINTRILDMFHLVLQRDLQAHPPPLALHRVNLEYPVDERGPFFHSDNSQAPAVFDGVLH